MTGQRTTNQMKSNIVIISFQVKVLDRDQSNNGSERTIFVHRDVLDLDLREIELSFESAHIYLSLPGHVDVENTKDNQREKHQQILTHIYISYLTTVVQQRIVINKPIHTYSMYRLESTTRTQYYAFLLLRCSHHAPTLSKATPTLVMKPAKTSHSHCQMFLTVAMKSAPFLLLYHSFEAWYMCTAPSFTSTTM